MISCRINPICFFSIFLCVVLYAENPPGFYVKGRYLYDKCGEKVILRGINKKIIWEDRDGIPSLNEIKKTGANAVRIVWLTKGAVAGLDTVITNCIERQMIPVIECHDATGKWELLPKVIDFWVRPDVVEVIQKHEMYLLLNIANEPGEWDVPADTFRTVYTRAVRRMRLAGIHVPLIIDPPDWGKNINALQSEGPALIASDPDHNLMFSIHMWWPRIWGYSDATVMNEIRESVEMELPLIVGEFGNRWDETEEGKIPYLTIIKQCQQNEIGWIAWSWGPGNQPQTWLDMTRDGTYESLFGWGLEVAVTDSFSIKNTSVIPQFILNGGCE